MSQSNVYLLQPKTISYLEKTKTSLRSLNLSLLPLVFPPNFHKEEYISLSLSLSLSLCQNFTKSSQDLFAISSIGERVLDLDEFDASEEDLESMFIESSCNLRVLVGVLKALATALYSTLYLASLPSSLFTSKTFTVFTHRRSPCLENFNIFL